MLVYAYEITPLTKPLWGGLEGGRGMEKKGDALMPPWPAHAYSDMCYLTLIMKC